MIDAIMCKINSLSNIEKFCSKEIEPLLRASNGKPIYFGKYNSSGSKEIYIYKLYAAEPPKIDILDTPKVLPEDIKSFLERLGYKVDWVLINEPYEAGYSGTKKTKYYNAGYNSYYSLKISY